MMASIPAHAESAKSTEPGVSSSGVPMSVAKRLDERTASSPPAAVVPTSGTSMREAKSGRSESKPAKTSTQPTSSSLSGVPMVVAKRL